MALSKEIESTVSPLSKQFLFIFSGTFWPAELVTGFSGLSRLCAAGAAGLANSVSFQEASLVAYTWDRCAVDVLRVRVFVMSYSLLRKGYASTTDFLSLGILSMYTYSVTHQKLSINYLC